MSDLVRLCLGTAKLGLPWYGAGSVSRPTRRESLGLLRRAVEVGIRWLDTATSYGGIEHAVLSSAWLASVRVVTKVWCEVVEDGDDWRAAYTLATWPVPPTLVLLHNPTVAQVTTLARRHMVDGASVYTPAEARAAMDAGLRVLQVPYCLLDRRHTEVIAEARARGVLVFARQPFLQGLLLNAVAHQAVEPHLQKTRPAITRCWDVMAEHAISRVEACLWFALESDADAVVFGVGSVAHLEEVVAAAERERPARWAACKAALLEAVRDVPPVELASLWQR